ncbi:MAG: hypothetical protein ACTHMC_28130 [Pseudobacter sp.]|uniref:hypothetical protein n=1 Tax=Pseudobacter sp. TaxID=2045420 RepID=UPI003F7EE4AB
MKAFARIDVIIQTLLILGGLVIALSLWGGSNFSDYYFLPYFIVGAWQIFSVIVHFAGEGGKMNKLRKTYLITLLIVLIILVASMASDAIIYSLFGLLFFSPLMALFYLYTCYRESQLYNQGKAGHDLSGQTLLRGNTPAAVVNPDAESQVS